MTDIEYMIAWVAYLLGAMIMYALFCRATRFLPWFELRCLIRIPAASILFVPAFADPAQSYLAPAFIVMLFDLANHDPSLGLRGAKFIVLVMLLLLALLFIESVARRLFARR